MPDAFYGRERELKKLQTLEQTSGAHLVVIKGRRRIGKSRLAAQFAKDRRFYTFSGLPPLPKVTAQDQKNEFALQLSNQFKLPRLQADDWTPLFTFLAEHTVDEPTVILLDEISWMGAQDPLFLPKLKNAWDLHFVGRPHLTLILCSSVSAWVDKNIIKSTGFFGRIHLTLSLSELSIAESAALLQGTGFRGSAQEIFKILSVTGGVPWYLEQINTAPASANIKRLCFEKEGLLVQEFEHLFHDLFAYRSPLYARIVQFLAERPRTQQEIHTHIQREKSGVLSDYLNDLIAAGFVSKDQTWVLKNAKPSRLSHYRLSDNYLCFYFRYIEPKLSQITAGKFEQLDLSSLPQFDGMMGLAFENLVLKNRPIIYEKLHLKPEHILADNPFFQRPTATQPGCQIDYLIQTKFNTLFACEIKCSRTEIKPSIIDEMREKLSRIRLPRNYSCFPVLIHVNGVSDEVYSSGYFSEIIDFSDWLTHSTANRRSLHGITGGTSRTKTRTARTS